MASLSDKLRRERELRGISLKQISDETKIAVRFLQALESGTPEQIPGEFYRRSYLRAYARCLGIDEDRALNTYAPSIVRQPDELPRAAPAGSKRRASNRSKWALGGMALVVPALALLWHQPSSREDKTPGVVPSTAAPSPGRVESKATATGPLTEEFAIRESGSDTKDPVSPAMLRVILSVDDTCWLEIVADGDVVASGLKEGGFRSEFTANEVRLWLGNAGVVRLWLNDQPAKSMGKKNQVLKDLTITSSNYMRFVQTSERAGPS